MSRFRIPGYPGRSRPEEGGPDKEADTPNGSQEGKAPRYAKPGTRKEMRREAFKRKMAEKDRERKQQAEEQEAQSVEVLKTTTEYRIADMAVTLMTDRNFLDEARQAYHHFVQPVDQYLAEYLKVAKDNGAGNTREAIVKVYEDSQRLGLEALDELEQAQELNASQQRAVDALRDQLSGFNIETITNWSEREEDVA